MKLLPKTTRRRILAAGALAAAFGLLLILAALATPSVRARVAARMGIGGPRPPDLAAAKLRLQTLLASATQLPIPNARLVIHKSQRRAELYAGDRLLKTYPIALGREPIGAKQAQGDNRTPEGDYRVCTRLDRSQYHLFLGLNYPNAADATAGLGAGRIDSRRAKSLAQSESRHARPDWETALGGAIGLHGGGVQGDWTLGCIAFDNEAIEELFVVAAHWTPVEIRP